MRQLWFYKVVNSLPRKADQLSLAMRALKKAINDEASSSSTLAEATADGGDCSFTHSDA